MIIKHYNHSKTEIYYYHSMQYYDTDIERKYMVFLSKQKNSTVINPNGMDIPGYDKRPIPEIRIDKVDDKELKAKIMSIDPKKLRELKINKSKLWYQQRKIKEGKAIKLYNKAKVKIYGKEQTIIL